MTREGGGRVAPCLRQRISHTASTSAMTTIGGTTRAATADAWPITRSPSGARFGESFRAFYVRTVPAQFRSAWRIETARLGDVDMRWYDLRLLRSRVVHDRSIDRDALDAISA